MPSGWPGAVTVGAAVANIPRADRLVPLIFDAAATSARAEILSGLAAAAMLRALGALLLITTPVQPLSTARQAPFQPTDPQLSFG